MEQEKNKKQENVTIDFVQFVKDLPISKKDRDILCIGIRHIVEQSVDLMSRSLVAMFTNQNIDSEEYNDWYNKNITNVNSQFVDAACREYINMVEGDKDNE